jgi:hypothetical protein
MDRRICEFLRNSRPDPGFAPVVSLSPQSGEIKFSPVSLWRTLRLGPAVPLKFKLGKEIET